MLLLLLLLLFLLSSEQPMGRGRGSCNPVSKLNSPFLSCFSPLLHNASLKCKAFHTGATYVLISSNECQRKCIFNIKYMYIYIKIHTKIFLADPSSATDKVMVQPFTLPRSIKWIRVCSAEPIDAKLRCPHAYTQV